MKTTDSVMREKLKEIMLTPAYPTAPACPYCDFAKGRDYSKTGIQHHIRKAHPGKENTRIDRIVDLFSHSLAEARREERERIKRVFYPMNKEDLLPIGKAIDEWVKLHEELGGEVVWQSMGDSEYDRPRPVRAIYHTPLKIFQGMMGIGDDLLTGDNPEEAREKIAH